MPANNDELLFPAIIWLDYWFDIQKHREDHYRKPRRYNKPIAAVRRIRLRQVTPSNPHEDPYIIAALIALAQAQWDWEQKTWMRKKPTNTQKLSLDINKTFKVSGLMSSGSDCISAKFPYIRDYIDTIKMTVANDGMNRLG